MGTLPIDLKALRCGAVIALEGGGIRHILGMGLTGCQADGNRLRVSGSAASLLPEFSGRPDRVGRNDPMPKLRGR